MLIYVFYLVAQILGFVALIYAIFKVIWYRVKMHALRSMLRELGDKVTFKQSFRGMLHAPKGAPICEIATPDGLVEVSLLSFMSVHGRWNIEKTDDGYIVEARRSQKMFYKVYYHAEQPYHAHDYRRENRFKRCPLELSPMDDRYAKQILVVYPRPIVDLTLATVRLDQLRAGDTLEGHEILFAEELVSSYIHSQK